MVAGTKLNRKGMFADTNETVIIISENITSLENKIAEYPDSSKFSSWQFQLAQAKKALKKWQGDLEFENAR